MKLYTIIFKIYLRQVFVFCSFHLEFTMTFSLLQLLYQYFGLRLDLSLSSNIITLKNTLTVCLKL